MDFGSLLHTAKKNDGSKKEIKYYSTKFEPPKKEQRNKNLSANIQKFLAKKEAEEKEKLGDAKRKMDDLLALRAQDKKSTRRVNVMLKRTKSANKSVLAEATSNDHTAVTLTGNSQPDEDDYGYVSQEAAAFYNKMMEKYNKMPDEPKFPTDKRRVSTNLNSTKARVKAALERERDEANAPHRRRRKREHEDEKESEKEREVERPVEKAAVAPKPKPRPAPPPINFADLLKMAEKKQFEPIVIEKKEVKEEERPLTKKQKRDLEREKDYWERKSNPVKPEQTSNRIPKVNSDSKPYKADRSPKSNGDAIPKSSGDLPKAKPNSDISRTKSNMEVSRTSKPNIDISKRPIKASDESRSKVPNDNRLLNPVDRRKPSYNDERNRKPPAPQVKTNIPPQHSKMQKKGEPNKSEVLDKKSYLFNTPSKNSSSPVRTMAKSETTKRPLATLNNGRSKEAPRLNVQPKKFPPADLRPKQFPPKDLKQKQFPPADVRRRDDAKRKAPKHRILDDDDEYDSEMDDFIDDGPEDYSNNYSKYISEIFGYDKSKYRYADEDVDNMETNFAQQMREEVISTKIGIMEDLEDMRQEEAQKKKKAIMKKTGKL